MSDDIAEAYRVAWQAGYDAAIVKTRLNANRLALAGAERDALVAAIDPRAVQGMTDHFTEGTTAKFIDCPMCRESGEGILAALKAACAPRLGRPYKLRPHRWSGEETT